MPKVNDPFLQSASNAIAGAVSTPVDAIAWALRKGGLDIKKPIGGSDWMREKGLTADVAPGGRQILGEVAGSLADPIAPISKAAMMVGLLRKIPLYVSHGSVAAPVYNRGWNQTQRALVDNGKLRDDLFAPSLAVSKKPPGDDLFYGNVHLVPDEAMLQSGKYSQAIYDTDGMTKSLRNSNDAALTHKSLRTRTPEGTNKFKNMDEFLRSDTPIQESDRFMRQYGEIKLLDRKVPLTPDNFPGIVIADTGTPTIWGHNHEESIKLLREQAKQRGIPSFQMGPNASEEELRQVYEYIQGLRK